MKNKSINREITIIKEKKSYLLRRLQRSRQDS